MYTATFEAKYFVAARELADQLPEYFTDPRGGFFDMSDDHENLALRPISQEEREELLAVVFGKYRLPTNDPDALCAQLTR